VLKGFRDFIMRGNVIDLAVGVVIGAAFNTLISSFTNSLLTPLIRAIGGNPEVKGKRGVWDLNGQEVDWASALNALISFVITAAVLYFLVVAPMNALAKRRARGETPPPEAPSEEIKLLTDIRDALVAQGPVPHPRTEQPAAAGDTEAPVRPPAA
jgi:large conductance mechanosensitive channel